jgi:hypothetical protein
MANLSGRVNRLIRRRGERCPHCGKFALDPVTTPGERATSHDIDPGAFADFIAIVEKCRGIPSPAPEELPDGR